MNRAGTARTPVEVEPIARVLPMLSVPHLDREFDYLVSAEQSDDAQPGVRVRVRFHGRLVDGFVLERRNDTDHSGKLGWLDRVVSAEPVLTAEIRRLVDAVAARYAGTRPDVLRLAVPARHARVEREPAPIPALPVPLVPAPVDPSGWEVYGRGGQFLAALTESRAARAVLVAWSSSSSRPSPGQDSRALFRISCARLKSCFADHFCASRATCSTASRRCCALSSSFARLSNACR